MNKSGIYTITNKVNDKVYVGSAVDIDRRWGTHRHYLRADRHSNTHLQGSWNKHGEDTFEFKVLLLCEREELIVQEQDLMDLYKLRVGWDMMYNLCPTAGNTLGRIVSQETRDKISTTKTGKPSGRKGYKHSAETKAKIRATKTGVSWGSHSQATKDKMSKAHKGKVFSEEHRVNLSRAHTKQKT